MVVQIALLLALGSASTNKATPPTAHSFPRCSTVENDSQLADATVSSAKSLWQGPMSVHEVEQSNMDANASGTKVPFGKFNSQWLVFKGSMRPRDRIYSATYAGRLYLHVDVLVRGGCIVRFGPMTVLS